jgi:hypothetical protein
LSVDLQSVVPIVRIFSVEKAREFYVGFLGFTWDWEHRFDENAPLYAQVSRGSIVLHLSEHHGDGSPGTHLYLFMTGIEALHRSRPTIRSAMSSPSPSVHRWNSPPSPASKRTSSALPSRNRSAPRSAP